MWNTPDANELRGLPRLYATENMAIGEKLIHMHFFLGGFDWYAAEYSPRERVFFGYAIFGNDLDNAEWGYFGLRELTDLRTPEGFEVDRDLYWNVRKASEIEKIAEAYRVQGIRL